MKTILITGGAGFIGANFLNYFSRTHAEYRIVCVDKLSYASDINNIVVVKPTLYNFYKIDIANKDDVFRLFQKYDFDGVIHIAAESHVDNSIESPRPFIFSNIVGTFNLLEAVRMYCRPAVRFHHVSTDEVYGDVHNAEQCTEQYRCAPSSPYSASKASADFLIGAYHRTYGLNSTISRCTNNYGKYQHAEKLIPFVVDRSLRQEKIPIKHPHGRRDWLHVDEHCRAIDLVFHKGKSGEIYNIAGKDIRDNIDVVRTVCGLLDKSVPMEEQSYNDLLESGEKRAGHDESYGLNTEKIERELGFFPGKKFSEGIKETVQWYVEKITGD